MERSSYQSNWDYLMDCIHFFGLCLRLPQEPRLREEARALAMEMDFCSTASIPGTEPTLFQIRRALSLEEPDWFCFLLALCCELDGAIRNGVAELCGTPVPTFDIAFSLFGALAGNENSQRLFAVADPAHSPLRFLLMPWDSDPAVPRLLSPLIPRSNVLGIVLDGAVGDGLCYSLARPCDRETLPLHTEIMTPLSQAACRNSLLFLSGRPGSGKRTLARRISESRELACLMIDLEAFCALDARERKTLIPELALDTVICGGFPCFFRYTPQREAELRALAHYLPAEIPLLVLSDLEECAPPALDGRAAVCRTIGALTAEDYARMRDTLCLQTGVAPEEVPDYRLTVGQMRSLWLEAYALCRGVGRRLPDRHDFSTALRMAGRAHDSISEETLADLVAAPETLNKLAMVCTLARNRRYTDERCRAAGIFPYGKGVKALFYGPSGTGKTMAARAVANELGMGLWRIDLSRVLDKYIGETEKHLAETFASAREENTILFFDEADALFGKRTEISSSHDRYANVETAFLLQSIEEYDGIVLLATNLYKNFDTAFLRRISVTVRFSMPDAALRLKLWQRAFPPGSLAANTDLAPLAQELELSPAAIRSAADTALVLAGTSPLTASLLTEALQNELGKAGLDSQGEKLRSLAGFTTF